jgi:response regulator of citrate/malate metabolism
MPDWRVLVVDDDPMSADLHRRIVSGQPGFAVVAVAPSSEQAMAVLRQGVRVDLILLDVELPGADGVTLLRALKGARRPEAIAVTANSDARVVQDLTHLGVVDFLVKPFAVERLQEALMRFKDRMHTLRRPGTLAQQQIDRLYADSERRLLPKGLNPETLQSVRSALRLGGERFSSAEDVAASSKVARVTARRYLEYLVSSHQAVMDTAHEGAGRPRKLYRLISTST